MLSDSILCLIKNTKYIRYVFSEYEGFVARTGGVARTGPILYALSITEGYATILYLLWSAVPACTCLEDQFKLNWTNVWC